MGGGAAVLTALCSTSAGAQPQPGAGGIYTCVDAKGRRLTADRPIAECSDREQRVLSPSGTERARVGPVLTDQERSALEAQRRKDAEERARIADERRRERVLVARYPDQAAHDAERAAAIAQVDDVTAVAEKRVAELRRQRKGLDAEMEFYRRDPAKAPMALRRQIAEQEDAVAEQQRFIAAQEQEKRRVHQRFDAELAVLRQLWAGQQRVPVPAAP
ncbi:DUF4124 domain-containing protein [Acidovorax sp. GBBC 3334]|uniref:DUF4124 domain-containing protein n=1 Tax=unclassified Acidovorax TaxID=2684926 RepID=UPI002304B463|nr:MULTISPECIES: DUF4124 domain-containing protein [unclassified Acidovorax]MDA8456738.1 DUF4124 domain-containing protein [Acidovorax sp. GBBC 3334]MDA8523036.1 DUF4124 domain-containing protein [Acidovorax sp. NCPPB 4044]